MSSGGDSGERRLPRIRPRLGWGIVVALAVAFLVAYVADARLKSGAFPGYAPTDSELVISSDDWPRFWEAVEGSDSFEAFDSHAPYVHAEFAVWLRKETGIRWTPARWRTWFGDALVAARTEHGWTVCTRPGLLVRMVLPVADWIGNEPLHEWRDGSLIMAQSSDALASINPVERREWSSGSGVPRVSMAWAALPKGEVEIVVAESVRVRGVIEFDHAPVGSRPGMVEAAAPDAVVTVSTIGGRELVDEFVERLPDVEMDDAIREALDELAARIPDEWQARTTGLDFAIVDVDTSEPAFVPEVALVLGTTEPWGPLAMPRDGIPFRWSGVDGWMAPWLGIDMGVYAAGTPQFRAYTNQEGTMSRLLAHGEFAADSEFRLRANFARIGEVAAGVLRTAAREDLVPRHNAMDVERELIPIANGVGALGVLEIDGEYEGNVLRIEGALTTVRDSDT